MLSNILIAVPVMAILTIVQTTVLPRFSLFVVTPSLPFLFALAWSLVNGVEEGIVWAFIGGLFMDIFTIAPVGGLSLTYMAAVLVVDLLSELLPANRWAILLISVVVATAVQQFLYFLYLRLFGVVIMASLSTFLRTVVVQVVLIIPIYWIIYLLRRAVRPRPVQI